MMTMQSPSISLDRVRRVTDPISTSNLGLGMYVCTMDCTGLGVILIPVCIDACENSDSMLIADMSETQKLIPYT